MSSSPSSKDHCDSSCQDEQIENLLRELHSQIKSSNWLETNTASKLEQENPELVKAWKNAIDSENNSNN